MHEQERVGAGGDPMAGFDDAARAKLLATPGIDGITLRGWREQPGGPDGGGRLLFVACDELGTTPFLGRCAAGAAIAAVELRLVGGVLDHHQSMADTTWPAADVTLEELTAPPVNTVVVATDGTTATVERARTVLVRTSRRRSHRKRSPRFERATPTRSTESSAWLTSCSSPACRSPAAASPSTSSAGWPSDGDRSACCAE